MHITSANKTESANIISEIEYMLGMSKKTITKENRAYSSIGVNAIK